MIAIINYGVGNLLSVEKALWKIGFKAVVTREAEIVQRAQGVVLPGVGAFKQAIAYLERTGLDKTILEVVGRGLPCLGICLGLQLLFTESTEGNPGNTATKGMGIFKGRVLKFEGKLKVPHVGWNRLFSVSGSPLFEGIREGEYVYFDHSYYVAPEDAGIVSAYSRYGITFASAVEKGNIFGVQFHPEKSRDQGLRILRNFGMITRERAKKMRD